MAVGAAGYVIKQRVAIDSQLAIREVLAGHLFISPDAVKEEDQSL
jgi:DNA-binding NarL/FixJ family response regulator